MESMNQASVRRWRVAGVSEVWGPYVGVGPSKRRACSATGMPISHSPLQARPTTCPLTSAGSTPLDMVVKPVRWRGPCVAMRIRQPGDASE